MVHSAKLKVQHSVISARVKFQMCQNMKFAGVERGKSVSKLVILNYICEKNKTGKCDRETGRGCVFV